VIPVSVITGFLGSGKTTLLSKLLRSQQMGRTAVIVNEFGEIGIDHDLIETSDESFVQLTTGCLCCRVRSDLVLTLHDLAARRAAGSVAPFDQVVVETSGLADPASILQALMTDPGVAENYVLGSVVTTADAVLGAHTLDQHPQSIRQAAAADHIVVTKSDLPQARAGELKARLATLNPGARVHTAVFGDLDPAALFGTSAYGPTDRLAHIEAFARGLHVEGITSASFVREAPVHAVALAMFLEALVEHCGSALLRVKGIVNLVEDPDHPAVIHGVQHVFERPVWLDKWPSEDRRTRMVFIGQHVPPDSWVRNLLAMLDAEVLEETARVMRGS
jgi:G3E family GTPase